MKLLTLFFAAPSVLALAIRDEVNDDAVEAIRKLTNTLLVDTEYIAHKSGLSLDDIVDVPGVSIKSQNVRRGEISSNWTDYVPLVRKLIKDILNGTGVILDKTGLGDVAQVLKVAQGFL